MALLRATLGHWHRAIPAERLPEGNATPGRPRQEVNVIQVRPRCKSAIPVQEPARDAIPAATSTKIAMPCGLGQYRELLCVSHPQCPALP